MLPLMVDPFSDDKLLNENQTITHSSSLCKNGDFFSYRRLLNAQTRNILKILESEQN